MLAHCRLRGKEGKERGGEGEKRKGACQCYQAVGNSQAAGLGDEGSLRSFSCAFPGLCKVLVREGEKFAANQRYGGPAR